MAAFSARARTVTGLQRVALGRASVERAVARLNISYSGTQIAHGLRKAASLLDVPVDIRNDPKSDRKDQTKKGYLEREAPLPKKPADAGYVRRIVLLSDGENIAGPDPVETATRLKQAGVVIDCIGIGERGQAARPGDGLDEKLLTAIASPGRYKYIRDSSTLLYHFEALASKVLDEWDSVSGEVALKAPAKSAADTEPLERVVLKRPLRQRLLGWVRDFAVQLAFGAVPGVILSVFGIRYALDTLDGSTDAGSWALPWLSVAWVGLVVAWVVRLGVYGVRSPLGVLAALVGAIGGYAAALYVQRGSVSEAADWVAEDPAPHAIAAAIATIAVALGIAFTPGHIASSLRRMPRPWALSERRRYGFTRLGEDSPYLGRQCLNEKDGITAFKAGDRVVFCPECHQPHHADCWVWNGGHCYGGDTPCSGHRPVPRTT